MRTTGANWSQGPSGARERRSLPAIGRVLAPVVALVLLTMLPPGASAAPVKDPAVDQYVESVPGAGGDRAPNTEPRSGGERLPADVRSEIKSAGGRDAEALAAVASSPALGAPRADRDGEGGGSSGDSGSVSKGPPSAIDAVTSAAASGDGDASGWLIAGLALLTAALAGTALARRRSLAR